jgi:hypothetical protein
LRLNWRANGCRYIWILMLIPVRLFRAGRLSVRSATCGLLTEATLHGIGVLMLPSLLR